MRRCLPLLGLVYCLAVPLWAADQVVELSAQQQAALEIERYIVNQEAGALSTPLPARLVLNDRHQRALTLPISGTIEQIDSLPGAVVAVGARLGTYHSREALALQRDYLSALDRLERSEASRRRDEALHEGGVISSKRWQQTLAEWRQRDALVKELASQLAALGFSAEDLQRLQQTRALRDRLPLRAPLAGAVLERHIEPGDAFTAGEELFQLGDVDQLWLSILAPAATALAAQRGEPVYFGDVAIGLLLQVGAAVDPASQSVTLTCLYTHLTLPTKIV